jgi:hypothetical protein
MAPVCTTCKDTHTLVIGEGDDERKVMCTFCPTPCPECRQDGNVYCTTTPCPCKCHASRRRAPKPIDSLVDIQRRFQNGLYESDDLDWVRGRLHDTVDAVLALAVTTEERLAALEGHAAPVTVAAADAAPGSPAVVPLSLAQYRARGTGQALR